MRRTAGPAGFSRIERELAHEEAGGDAADRGAGRLPPGRAAAGTGRRPVSRRRARLRVAPPAGALSALGRGAGQSTT